MYFFPLKKTGKQINMYLSIINKKNEIKIKLHSHNWINKFQNHNRFLVKKNLIDTFLAQKLVLTVNRTEPQEGDYYQLYLKTVIFNRNVNLE